jgi:hypothetical protein
MKLTRVSVWAVRLALLYLVAGFSLGALLLADKGVPFAPWAWSLLPAHMDFLLFGFFIQFIIGVGFTMLPRFRSGERGNPRLVWASLFLLNLGIGLVVLQSWRVLPGGFLITGRVLQAGAALVFLMNVWGRVRAFTK